MWVAVLVLLVGGGVAYATSSSSDPLTDEDANDVRIREVDVVELFTASDKKGRDKNFKYSFSRPIEIWPGHYCVSFAADLHYQEAVFPTQQCFDAAGSSPDVRAYVARYAVRLETVNAAINANTGVG